MMILKQTLPGGATTAIQLSWFEKTKIGQSPSQNYHYQNQIFKISDEITSSPYIDIFTILKLLLIIYIEVNV